MNKRLICLLLSLILLAGSIPPAFAAETETLDGAFITVNVLGDERPVLVYPCGEDLLFSAGDLAAISGFALDRKDDTIALTRGKKTIYINTDTNVLTCSVVSGSKTLTSPVQKIGDEWYLSGAELLRWLNVAIEFRKGVMYVIPNSASIWDLVGEVDLRDYGFKVETCAEIMNISGADVNAIIYMERHSSSVLFNIGRKDTLVEDEKEYYDILDDFMLDKSAADSAITPILEDLEVMTGLLEGVAMFLKALGIKEIDDAVETTSNIAEGLGRFMLYCALFECDNDMKLSILKSLYSERTYDYDDKLTMAARRVYETYTDFWKGLLYMAGYDTVEGLVEGLEDMTGRDIIEAFKLEWTDASVDNTWLERIPSYRVLTGTALQVCNRGWGNADTTGLQDYVSHAMLYLYASEQCYRGIIQYIIDNGYEEGFGMEMIREFRRIASKIETMYGKFQAAALYLKYDLCSMQSHSQDYAQMTEKFQNLEIRETQYGITRTAEMMIYMAALEDMPIRDMAWTVMDPDQDGAFEYVIQGLCQEGDDLAQSYMVLDGTNLGIFTPMGWGTYANLLECDGGDGSYVHYGCFTTDRQADIYFEWTGSKWSPTMQRETTGGNTICRIRGENVTPEQYESALQEHGSSETPDMVTGALPEQSIPGDPKANYDILDAYFAEREGYLEKIVFDLDLDGDIDRAYAIHGAAELWKQSMLTDECTGSEIPFRYQDNKLTVLFAQNASDSVLLRVYRIDVPDGGDILSAILDLLKSGSNCLLDYCNADYATIQGAFPESGYATPDIYGDGSVWNFSSMIGQGLGITFYFFDSDYEDLDARPYLVSIDDLLYWSGSTTGAEICPGLNMGMTYAEAAGTIDLTELDWAPEQRSTEPVYLCYGDASGCELELFFTGPDMDTAILVGVNAAPTG